MHPEQTAWTPKSTPLKGDLQTLRLPKTFGEFRVSESLALTDDTISSPLVNVWQDVLLQAVMSDILNEAL